MFLGGSKFCEQFLKRVTQGTFLWIYFKFWPAVLENKIFLRISSCPYSVRSPHSPEPCLRTDQNFANNFWKGSPKEHSCEIISKLDQRFQRRRFLNKCLKNSILLPWQPEFLMESNSVNNFWRGTPKEHSCLVWSKLAQQFGRRRCLKKLLTTHDGHITTLKASLERVVLSWAKNSYLSNWKHLQTKNIYNSKSDICTGRGNKYYCKESENNGYLHLLLFPTFLSKSVLFRVIKTLHYM